MNKFAILALVLAIGLAAGCGKESEQEKQTQRPLKHLEVVATTGIIADIVRNVGGDLVGITALMGPGVDPHSYEATEDDLDIMANADVILYNGLDLESAMAEQLERMSERVRTVAVSEAFDVAALLKLEEPAGGYDPHVWFDVRLWMIAVEHIRNVLTELDPDYDDVYFYNADVYLDQIAELHDFAHNELQHIPVARRVLITAHDAFRYFGRAYGFRVRGLQGTSTVSDIGDTAIQDLVKFISVNRVPVIFSETSVSSEGIEAVKAALADRGVEVELKGPLYSDAVGETRRPQGTYIGMIQHDIQTIVTALRGDMDGMVP